MLDFKEMEIQSPLAFKELLVYIGRVRQTNDPYTVK